MDRENGSTFNTSIPYPSYLLISVALGLLAMSLIHPVPYPISLSHKSQFLQSSRDLVGI